MTKPTKRVQEFIEAIEGTVWGIMTRDPKTATVWGFNRAITEITGFAKADVIGKRAIDLPWKLRSLDNKPLTLADIGRDTLKKSRTPVDTFPIGIDRPDGKTIWVAVNTQAYKWQGRVRAMITSMVDITRQIEAIQTIVELEETKVDIIQQVAHELRTPVTVVKGYSGLMVETGVITGEWQRIVEQIMMPQLDRIVDISDQAIALTARHTDLSPVDMLPEIHAATAVFYKHTAKLSIDHAHTEPATCRANAALVRQSLRQLIENAIKFTPKKDGRIVISSAVQDGWYVISVADTGVGIPAGKLHRIWEPFYQVDGSSRRQFGGLGLGLPVVKLNMELMKGQVTVESQEGKGSVFRLWFRVMEV